MPKRRTPEEKVALREKWARIVAAIDAGESSVTIAQREGIDKTTLTRGYELATGRTVTQTRILQKGAR